MQIQPIGFFVVPADEQHALAALHDKMRASMFGDRFGQLQVVSNQLYRHAQDRAVHLGLTGLTYDAVFALYQYAAEHGCGLVNSPLDDML